MLKNLDCVVLTIDLPALGLRKDDVGTIVDVHPSGSFEVEFIAEDGTLIALETFTEAQVRALDPNERFIMRTVA